jgi:hypothetical protein
MKDYLKIFSEKLSPVAGHTLLWCIENVWPIYNLQKKNRHVFFYEDLVDNPEREFDHMIRILGLKIMPESSIILRPSQQASRELKSKLFKKNNLERWRTRLNGKQLSEIDLVLKFFNVTIYNAYKIMPINRIQDYS